MAGSVGEDWCTPGHEPGNPVSPEGIVSGSGPHGEGRAAKVTCSPPVITNHVLRTLEDTHTCAHTNTHTHAEKDVHTWI